jgi:predicted anti-sigma-YlaC factor YlaD
MRAWISADLDGELSELESIRLQSHLDRCESCSTFKLDVANFTVGLRDAPLEPLSTPLVAPRRRRLAFQPLRVPAAAAVVVAMVGLGGVFASLHSASIIRSGNETSSSAAGFDDQSLRALRLQHPRVVVEQLVERRAQAESARIPRRTGFQNP